MSYVLVHDLGIAFCDCHRWSLVQQFTQLHGYSRYRILLFINLVPDRFAINLATLTCEVVCRHEGIIVIHLFVLCGWNSNRLELKVVSSCELILIGKAILCTPRSVSRLIEHYGILALLCDFPLLLPRQHRHAFFLYLDHFFRIEFLLNLLDLLCFRNSESLL